MTTPFYTELVKKLTNPMKQKPYKESSVKPVYVYLKNLNGGIPPTSIDFLLDRPLVLTRLEKYAVNTQRSIVFAIRNIAKDFEREDILKVWKENIAETEAGKGLPEPLEKSEAQQKAYAQLETDEKGDAWDVIMKKLEERNEEFEKDILKVIKLRAPFPPSWVMENGIRVFKVEGETDKYEDASKGFRNLEYIVPNLYILFPPRRNLDYTEMKLVSEFKSDLSKEFNYLVISVEKGKTVMRFVFNRYKTDGTYREQIFDVPEDLVVQLKRWISATDKKDGDFLLTKIGRYTHEKQKGDKLRSDDITDALHKAFGSGISTQMLRHMYIDKYNTPEREKVIHEMMGDAEKMAHSMTTQQTVYKKKKTIRVRVEKD
jgi:DNA-binding protein Fis